MSNNGLLRIPNAASASPQLVVAQPFNDVQFLAVIAAQIPEPKDRAPYSARERVQLAVKLAAEAVVAFRGSAIQAAVKKIEGEDV